MTALISTLVGAASSALATLVPNGRSAGAAGDGAEADFNQLLSTALEGQQGATAVAGALAQDAAPAEDGATGTTAEGADAEALAAALGIAGAVGAELAGRNAASTAAATAAAATTAAATTAAATTGSPDTAEAAATAETAKIAAGARAAVAAADLVPAEAAAELASPIDPRRVQRGLGQLNGEFRGRLDRVIERMESEFGHRVQVVETVRPQERQDFLFAQGRTRPGPVVTWTRDSNHTDGRAADLLIDGSYDNAIAFRRLARIAQEEGLRTLGARDPGHIELPGSGGGHVHATESRGFGAVHAAPAAAGAQPGVARVAEVAQVASVAQPRVAQVARVAVPGAPVAPAAVQQQRPAAFGARLADATLPSTAAAPVAAAVVEASVAAVDARLAGAAPSAPVADAVIEAGGRPLPDPASRPAPAPATAPAAVPAEAGAARTELASVAVHREREVTEGAETGARAEAAAETAGREAAPPVAAAEQGSPRAQQAAGAREVAPVFGADAAERVARVLQIQDGAAARPMSQMVLRIDTPDGGVDTIRVDVRGGSVGASIRTSDAGIAEQMTARIGDLQRALESQGLEAEVLQVQTTTADASDTVRAVSVSDVAGSRTSSDAGAQNSDRDEPAQRESLFRDRDEDGDAPRQQQRGRRDPNQARDR